MANGREYLLLPPEREEQEKSRRRRCTGWNAEEELQEQVECSQRYAESGAGEWEEGEYFSPTKHWLGEEE